MPVKNAANSTAMPNKPVNAAAPHTTNNHTADYGKYPYVPKELEPLAVPVDSLKLWDKNPRKNDQAAKRLAELIKTHGFVKPVVRGQDNVVYAGNTALKAARLLGMTHVPSVVKHFKSAEAATAYALSDNKASEWSEWDMALLKDMMDVETIDVKTTGFTQSEAAAIRAAVLFDEADYAPDIDIRGNTKGLVKNFLIIVFDNMEELSALRKKLGMRNRALRVPYYKLKEAIYGMRSEQSV